MGKAFRRMWAALLAIGALALAAAPARALELLAGGYAHGLGTKQGQEGGADLLVGLRTDKIDSLWFLGKPAVHLIAAGNTNVSTDFVAVGFDWPITILRSRFYVRPGIGFAYTTGIADPGKPTAPGISAAEAARRARLGATRIEFGSNDLFEPELAFGYRFSRRWVGELSYVHLSNGQILHQGKNQGLDDIGLRLAYHFGQR